MGLKALEGIEALFVIAPGCLVHSWGMTNLSIPSLLGALVHSWGMAQHLPAAGPGPLWAAGRLSHSTWALLCSWYVCTNPNPL